MLPKCLTAKFQNTGVGKFFIGKNILTSLQQGQTFLHFWKSRNKRRKKVLHEKEIKKCAKVFRENAKNRPLLKKLINHFYGLEKYFQFGNIFEAMEIINNIKSIYFYFGPDRWRKLGQNFELVFARIGPVTVGPIHRSIPNTLLLHKGKYLCVPDLLFDWFGFCQTSKSVDSLIQQDEVSVLCPTLN